MLRRIVPAYREARQGDSGRAPDQAGTGAPSSSPGQDRPSLPARERCEDVNENQKVILPDRRWNIVELLARAISRARPWRAGSWLGKREGADAGWPRGDRMLFPVA